MSQNTSSNLRKRFVILNTSLGLVLLIAGIVAFSHGWILANEETLLVLTFHGVVDNPLKPWEITYNDLVGFIDKLKKYGFEPLSPSKFEDWWSGKISGGRRFMVTFDDGLSSSGDAILKLSSNYQIDSALFIVTDLIGTPGYLSWEDLKKLASIGCVIGLHGKRHEEPVNILDRGEDFNFETSFAIQEVEKNLGFKPTLYAYPYGSFNDKARDIIASQGFTFGFTIEAHKVTRGHDRFLLPRLMYLKGIEHTGEPSLHDWIPPDNLRKSNLFLTLGFFLFIWSGHLFFRVFQIISIAKK